MCGQSMQEVEYTEAGNYIHTNGCIDTLVNWIHSNLFLLGGIALGLSIPQVQEYGAWHKHLTLRADILIVIVFAFCPAAGRHPLVSDFD